MFSKSDYIAHYSEASQRTWNWAKTNIFFSMGYILAPLFASYLIIKTGNEFILFMSLLLLIAFIVFIILRKFSKNKIDTIQVISREKMTFPKEFISWKRMIKILYPVYIFVFFLTLINAVFWTAGPIYSEDLIKDGYNGALIMVIYGIPTLFAGLFAHKLSRRFGKKRTAYVSILLLALTLIIFSLTDIFDLRLILVFSISFFEVIAFVLINATLTDYVAEATAVENEIVAVNDFFTNIGYIAGPIFAGILLDAVGISKLYGFLGVIAIIFIIVIIRITPKEINIRSSDILD